MKGKFMHAEKGGQMRRVGRKKGGRKGWKKRGRAGGREKKEGEGNSERKGGKQGKIKREHEK